MVNQVSPVAQAAQVVPDAQAIQVEKVFPGTLVHKETAAHKDHLAAQETPERLVALAKLEVVELAISAHRRVWPQATRIPSGIPFDYFIRSVPPFTTVNQKTIRYDIINLEIEFRVSCSVLFTLLCFYMLQFPRKAFLVLEVELKR